MICILFRYIVKSIVNKLLFLVNCNFVSTCFENMKRNIIKYLCKYYNISYFCSLLKIYFTVNNRFQNAKHKIILTCNK